MDKINWLAEEIKGFLWRLAASQVTYEALDAFKADFPGFRRERLFYNMSV